MTKVHAGAESQRASIVDGTRHVWVLVEHSSWIITEVEYGKD